MVGSVLGGAGLALEASNIGAQSPLSAQLLIDRIKTQFGPWWRTTPTDAFHAGMWLKTFISEVPVGWLPAGEPFTKV